MSATPQRDKFEAWLRDQIARGLKGMNVILKTAPTDDEAFFAELNAMNDAIEAGHLRPLRAADFGDPDPAMN